MQKLLKTKSKSNDRALGKFNKEMKIVSIIPWLKYVIEK